MLKKSISFRGNSADRHVSSNSSYRVRSQILSACFLVLFAAGLTPVSRAEEFSGGSAVELAKETILRRGPQEDAEIIGKLPKNTVLTITGQGKGQWLPIEVELVDGVVQGWVDRKALKNSGIDEEAEKSDSSESRLDKKPKRKRRIPDDEIAVLKRESTFIYGIYGGFNYGILQLASDTESDYRGTGFQGGGLLSFFLTPEVSLGAEIGLSQIQGSQSAADNSLATATGGARLMDVAAVLEYQYKNFRIFTALQYSFGIGISDFTVAQVASSSDVSGFWLRGGGGYAFPLSDMVNLVAKGFLGYSFNKSVLGLQTFGVSLFLEFKG